MTLPLFAPSSSPPAWFVALHTIADDLGLVIEPGPNGIALFGPGGTGSAYRYLLTRNLPGDGPPLPFCLINPSTADHEAPDPTVTRCVGFGRALGASAILICNPFAFRDKDVRTLRYGADPVGPCNDDVLRWVADRCRAGTFQRPIAGWGPPSKIPAVLRPRLAHVADIFGAMDALELTKGGHPSHPLMLKAERRPIPWSAP